MLAISFLEKLQAFNVLVTTLMKITCLTKIYGTFNTKDGLYYVKDISYI